MFGPFIHGTHLKVSPPQLLILITVRNGKKYGYEILKDLRDSFEGVWEPKTGAIYPAIKKLQENGFLVSEMVGDKEHYALSESGRDLLVHTLPRLGAMVTLSARFMKVVEDARNELGLDTVPVETLYDTDKDDQLQRLRDMRKSLESSLMRVNETIDTIEKGTQ